MRVGSAGHPGTVYKVVYRYASYTEEVTLHPTARPSAALLVQFNDPTFRIRTFLVSSGTSGGSQSGLKQQQRLPMSLLNQKG